MVDKAQRDISLGQRAESLLHDEMLRATFASLKDGYIAEWVATPINAQSQREMLWLRVRAVNEVLTKLETILVNGKMAKHKLET